MPRSQAAKARNWNLQPAVISEVLSDLRDLEHGELRPSLVKNYAARASAVIMALKQENARLTASPAQQERPGE